MVLFLDAGSVCLLRKKQKTVDVVKKRVQDFFYESPYEEIFNLLTPRFRDKPRNYDYIEFDNGARYQFITRTRLGGLGMTVDDLINDEAADMLDAHQATLVPTTSAAPSGNPQIIYCGTPPMAETVGEVFARVRQQIMDTEKGAWTEWGVDELTDKNNVEAWYKTNPSLDKTLLRRVIEAEARSLSVDSFNRMRLGWWSGVESKRAISQKKWGVCYTKKPDYNEEFLPVFAVKFAPDRSAYSLAGSLPLKDGRIHTEVIKQRPMDEGFGRLTEWLYKRRRNCAQIVIDGATGQAILYEDLVDAGIPKRLITQPSMKDITAAHQFAYDAITRGEFSHYNQPLLNRTVNVTTQRTMGRYGGFGWESMSKDLSTCALDAATFAYWGQKIFGKKAKTRATVAENNKKWHDILSSL